MKTPEQVLEDHAAFMEQAEDEEGFDTGDALELIESLRSALLRTMPTQTSVSMTVEFAILYENFTWETQLHDVPTTFDNTLPGVWEEHVTHWFTMNILHKHPAYRKAVMACIYNENPEQE